MKLILSTLVLLVSFSTFAQICNLSSNNESILELKAKLNQAEIRSEDYSAEIKRLQEDRFEMIIECIRNEDTQGISRQEVSGAKDFLAEIYSLQIETLDESVRSNLERDQIEMALQLRMERDILLLEESNIKNRLDKIIKDASTN